MPRQTIAFIKWLRGLDKIIFLLVSFVTAPLATASWQPLALGIEYQDLENNLWSHIHAFRINLKDNRISLITAQDLSLQQASVEEYAQHTNSLITINGGFFDKNHHPLGLRIGDKHQQNPLKPISWWGIFYIQHQKPYLTSANYFVKNSQIDFAIQSGPRLIINNHIPRLKPGLDERSALGITSNGQVIILVTENRTISTKELAYLMKAPPLNCRNALNLDGGSSSQLRARIKSFQLNVHGFSNVSDAIIVKPIRESL